jgi:hypothetical protein
MPKPVIHQHRPRRSALSSWSRLSDVTPHYQPLKGQCIECCRCGDARTWAQHATSSTLARWRVIIFPHECYCPQCADIMLEAA